MPSLLFCILGSLLNLPSFSERLSVWYLLQRSEGPKPPWISKLMPNWDNIKCLHALKQFPLPSSPTPPNYFRKFFTLFFTGKEKKKSAGRKKKCCAQQSEGQEERQSFFVPSAHFKALQHNSTEKKDFDISDACLYFVESAGITFELLRYKPSELSQGLKNTGRLFCNIVNCVFIETLYQEKAIWIIWKYLACAFLFNTYLKTY